MGVQTVLIVEDDLVNRKILKKLLSGHYNTLEAENGSVAWDIIKKSLEPSKQQNEPGLPNRASTISAILLDIIMPVMNGYELLAKLREEWLYNLPVIVTTGLTDAEAELRALQAGAWDFVSKPYDAKILRTRLRNAIARSEYQAKYLLPTLLPTYETDTVVIEKKQLKSNLTFLVVGGDDGVHEMISDSFGSLYRIRFCETADEGLNYLTKSSTRVRLILAFNTMTDMSPPDFLRLCKKKERLSDIPVIMFMGESPTAAQVEVFGEGAYDCITAPYICDIVQARIRHVLKLSNKSTIFEMLEHEYEKKTRLDAATQLFNKVAFKGLSSQMISSLPVGCAAMFVLDIDDFKLVNDQHGHLVGDKVIFGIADELSAAFRKTDILGRFGGDEFVVLMTAQNGRLSEASVKRKAARLIKNVQRSCLQALNVNTSISIGLSFTATDDTFDALFSRADQALYEAKNTGKGKAVIYGERTTPVSDSEKPVVLICERTPKLLPSAEIAYGDSAEFVCVNDYAALTAAFLQLAARISAICIDTEENGMIDREKFYGFILENGGGKQIPILAVCADGNMEQLREAMKLEVFDILTLPTQHEMLRKRLAKAIISSKAMKEVVT